MGHDYAKGAVTCVYGNRTTLLCWNRWCVRWLILQKSRLYYIFTAQLQVPPAAFEAFLITLLPNRSSLLSISIYCDYSWKCYTIDPGNSCCTRSMIYKRDISNEAVSNYTHTNKPLNLTWRFYKQTSMAMHLLIGLIQAIFCVWSKHVASKRCQDPHMWR